MKYKTLIWSGCSHSYGSGMFDENNHEETEDLYTKPVEWCNPKCYKDFPNVISVKDAMRDVAARAYPNQIGKEMGFENTYNLSIPGKGIESQFRKVTSFIINNEDTIDFTKAVFCYQLPAFNRVEILDTTNDNKNRIDFLNYNFQTLEENNEISMYYFLNHFDFDYYIAKFLMYLYEYKGFIESKGIKFLPFTFINGPVLNEYKEIWPYLKSEDYMTGINGMNPNRMWEQADVRFPKRITLIEKIEFWNINWEYPNKVKTLKEEGYCNDGHFSPKGHDALTQNLIPQLKEKLEI
jgi:hypothetical protein